METLSVDGIQKGYKCRRGLERTYRCPVCTARYVCSYYLLRSIHLRSTDPQCNEPTIPNPCTEPPSLRSTCTEPPITQGNERLTPPSLCTQPVCIEQLTPHSISTEPTCIEQLPGRNPLFERKSSSFSSFNVVTSRMCTVIPAHAPQTRFGSVIPGHEALRKHRSGLPERSF